MFKHFLVSKDFFSKFFSEYDSFSTVGLGGVTFKGGGYGNLERFGMLIVFSFNLNIIFINII